MNIDFTIAEEGGKAKGQGSRVKVDAEQPENQPGVLLSHVVSFTHFTMWQRGKREPSIIFIPTIYSITRIYHRLSISCLLSHLPTQPAYLLYRWGWI